MKESLLKLDPPAIQAALDADRDFSYGDIIELEWLQQAFCLQLPEYGSRDDFQAHQFKFLAAMDLFRDEMLQTYKKALCTLRGIGYRVVRPEEQTGFAMKMFVSKLSKEIMRASEILDNINAVYLTADNLKENADSKAKLAAIAVFSKRKLLQ